MMGHLIHAVEITIKSPATLTQREANHVWEGRSRSKRYGLRAGVVGTLPVPTAFPVPDLLPPQKGFGTGRNPSDLIPRKRDVLCS